MDMPLHPTWGDLAFRLVLTFAAGFLIGLNRETRGHAAGLRTTLLVCLAASVAMIQTNLLLPLAGKPPNGFAVMDLMRLPLGILTGVGFIGGGAILKRGSLVMGVTTASTLWMTTVIGLCFGGGQWVVGLVATALTLFVLAGLKVLDAHLPKTRAAVISVTSRSDAPIVELMKQGVIADIRLLERRWENDQLRYVSRYNVRYRGPEQPLLDQLARLAREPDVTTLRWALTPD